MEIRIDRHTLQRAEERGTNEREITDVLLTGADIPAKFGRLGKARVYGFEQQRHGQFYAQKRVEVFYVEEGNGVVTVTVYVFYGQWGET